MRLVAPAANAAVGKICGARVRGSAEQTPLEEVNDIYKSEVGEDRVRESAKVVRLQILWSAIERRRGRDRGPGKRSG